MRKRDGDAKIKSGTYAIIFERDHYGSIQFYAWTTIQHAKTTDAPKQDLLAESTSPSRTEGVFSVRLELGPFNYLNPPRPIRLFSHSLLLVTNFDSPDVHFNRQFRKIGLDDFITLRDGVLFFARTFFMTWYERMGRALQLSLQAYCMGLGTNISDRSVSYQDRARLLVRFFEDHILPAAAYLSRARQIYDRIQCDGKPMFREWIISIKDDRRVHARPFGDASEHAQRIVDLVLGDERLLTQIADELNKPIERRFEELQWTAPL
ncbi:hypothetical protein [Polyangium spumosum]|uniref:Uncharacterized protein n=1 Tax=Polyangium spumosum TaxID=889282 RepID=A0A6N7Q688_9BACT|nr:hypothetical protein [Polyangium spumosum]MRG98410.1 hypothetical protein [Polyangium spumosum]